MDEKKLILITGRSTVQGTGISTGKSQEDYQTETSALQLNRSDMEKFGLSEGDVVRVKTGYGQTTAHCRSADLPDGMAFMAFGPATSQLSGGETYASGMPDTKGFEIELEPVPA
jgi:formylmethanofuran dehydrogenase subunit D